MSRLLAALVLLSGIWAAANRASGQVALQPYSQPNRAFGQIASQQTNPMADRVLDGAVYTNQLEEFNPVPAAAGNLQAYGDAVPDAPPALWEVYPGVGWTPMSGINPSRSIYRSVYKPVYRSVYRRYGYPTAYGR